MEVVENLKGWRNRFVYADGEKVTWDSVFGFSWCYAKRNSSYQPELYCFGYEQDWQFNIWGCIQANLPFFRGDWGSWGRWVNNKGEWEFDKDRIKHELVRNLYQARFCPALQPDLVDAAIAAIPERVNPARDKDWEFEEDWSGQGSLVVTIKEYGMARKVTMKGVRPTKSALQKIAKQLKTYRLPKPPG